MMDMPPKPTLMKYRISVVIATKGRGDFLIHVLRLLETMDRPPNTVCISAVEESDVTAARREWMLPIVVAFGPAGLTAQRNTGVRAIRASSDIIVFFDDDFFPSKTWLALLEEIFERHPAVFGVGGITLADGARTMGVPVEQALKMIEEFDKKNGAFNSGNVEPRDSLYGCNMAFRSHVFETLSFDENLPLYGWQEDRDFSRRVSKIWPMVMVSDLVGVHLGLKGGRVSGVSLGMAQVVNPIYLWKKETLTLSEACVSVIRSFMANVVKSIWPEPYIDRRGRLWGNVKGIACLLSGNIDPTNMSRIK
jgi:Glycosyltransferase like family 2